MHILTGDIILNSIYDTATISTQPCTHPALKTSAVIQGGSYGAVVVEDLLLFSNLTFLDIGNNRLRFGDFSVLPKLEELRMNNNCISKIDCPPSGYKLLKKLDLSNNELSESALVKLGQHFQTKLVYLNLSNNYLTVLPKEICHLQKLETFILDNNECSDTQLSLVGFLPSLRTLSFNNNKISKYLHHSGIFSSLLELYLNQNRITTLQDLVDVTKLPAMKTIYVRDNPLKSEECIEKITMPAFFGDSRREIEFIVGCKVPQKKKRKKKIQPKAEPSEEIFDDGLFLTQVDLLETLQSRPTTASSSSSTSFDDFSNDWIPDFILEALYGHVPNTKNSVPGQQVLNTLRTTVLHPRTFHLPSQKVIKKNFISLPSTI
eukprot:Phypoly_transcript_05547.p1 GENE.Phypoly_transcript_05547~~Phypoly_transcript_05547.p1  ORF type:complete len:376 (+),score=46.35 Phypoly_transcript_05547:72-1199(+)